MKYKPKQYISHVIMTKKIRILVEGRMDKAHISNLLNTIETIELVKEIKIDTAEELSGKSNSSKIDEVHNLSKEHCSFNNLYLLRDREFLKFTIGSNICDLMPQHESDGNLYWTIGHSIENYFLKSEILCEAFRFLCGSEYKSETISLFKINLPETIKIIATITLAAKELQKNTYPIGKLNWENFQFYNNQLMLNIDQWYQKENNALASSFVRLYKKYISFINTTDQLICERICRGHTAVILIQRIFAACLYSVASQTDELQAYQEAQQFSKKKEQDIAYALCESWVRFVKSKKTNFPDMLITALKNNLNNNNFY